MESWVKFLTTPGLSDAEISRMMKEEFPGRKSAIFDAVQTVRNRYNKGAFTKGEIPKQQSVRAEEKSSVKTEGKVKTKVRRKK
jgi:hypothetical protein